MRVISLLVFCISVACASDPASVATDVAAGSVDVPPDVASPEVDESDVVTVNDAAGDDVTIEDVTAPDEFLPASSYCETAVDAFCPYYLRCGRMAVPDEATCRAVFLETCNARYEPVYADFAARGSLALSAQGVAACQAHLAVVACDAQLGDLDGPCGSMWLGQAPAGAPCGPGIESLICDETSTCRIDLSFCGQCVALALPGEVCDLDHRCPDDGACVEGACVPRVQTAEPCDEASVCEAGAGCVADPVSGETHCLGPTIVALGESCDGERRCPYKSVCSGGTCKATSLLGEACTPAIGCASGSCTDDTCVPLGGTGAPCHTSLDCVSGRCAATKTCAPLGPACP
ncbi:MAG: hypothetical protein IV100_35080 [Myxococcales bacterium]|nr:hypothetical protein [Myxococcales bacterium]